MEQGLKVAALTGLVLFILFCLFIYIRQLRQWRLNVKNDFEAALKTMHISTYELLVNRSTAPSIRRPPEVYRILSDQHGHYFLYLHSGVNPGVFQPLPKDRALLAAKMNG
jgi:hypothetical protein